MRTSTVENIDEDLEVAYTHCTSQDMIIIMGDLNAKIGKVQDPLKVTVLDNAMKDVTCRQSGVQHITK